MRTIQTNVYQYDELNETAKAKARDWYAGIDNPYWYESVYEDALSIADILGIKISSRNGGKGALAQAIYFSGFSSQGDGACFEGHYQYKAGSVKAVKDYAPQDSELHRIAEQLQAVQKAYFYKLRARMTQRGHYNHSGCMAVEVFHYEDQYRDIGDAEETIRQLMRDFADWIYSQLNKEYDYQTSDEAVEENIRTNDYEFTEDGERV